MEDKTISAMPQVEQLDGSELVPVVQEGQNRKATMAQIVDKAQEDVVMKESGKGLSTNDYTDTDKTKLGALLSNEQFGLSGEIVKDGNITNSTNYIHSPLIALNRNEPLIIDTYLGLSVYLAFYDESKKFISCKVGNNYISEIIAVGDYPINARYFIVATLRNRYDGKVSHYFNGLTHESRESAMSEAVVESAKLVLFVKLWTRCYDCQYDKAKDKPFTCNGVELTYDEAVDVYNAPRFCQNNTGCFSTIANKPKTIILGTERSVGEQYSLFDTFRTPSLEAIRVSPDTSITYVKSIGYAFYGDYKLKRILGIIGFTSYQENNMNQAFSRCTALEDVFLYRLRKDVSFADCPNLSAESLMYMVSNKQGDDPITITVHPTVYAKLTAERTGLDDYLPANLLVNSQEIVTSENLDSNYSGISIAIGLNTRHSYFWTLNSDKFTFSVGSIENLIGEPTAYDVSGRNKLNDVVWGSTSEITAANKSTTISASQIADVRNVFLYAGKEGHTQGNRVKFKNIKMEFGENPNPKWTPAISEIADEGIRERVMWATIADIAVYRNISFATTE